ncbi:nitroreductase [Polymorphobacter multimanifer]|nr:nitroreductase [Polymorphobacter multimanifer]
MPQGSGYSPSMIFNDTSSALALLTSRRSGKARELAAPGPTDPELATILGAAMRVPDHGKLVPWRFVVVPPQAREALAALLVDAYSAEKPEASAKELDAMRSFAGLAPTLVVLIAALKPESHIPLGEQQLSVGAAAMQLLNAAHALGYVGNWLTGWAAYSPTVAAALGQPGATIAGFFFLGTATRPLEERLRPDPQAVVSHWLG